MSANSYTPYHERNIYKESSTENLIQQRNEYISKLRTLEYLEKRKQPGERVNEKTRWGVIQSLINVERELISRNVYIELTHFTSCFFPNYLNKEK